MKPAWDGKSQQMFKTYDAMLARIKNDFTYHRPSAEVAPIFVEIREKAKELALLIAEKVPGGREQATALTRLEEAVFHANAGIARQFPVEAPPSPASPSPEGKEL